MQALYMLLCMDGDVQAAAMTQAGPANAAAVIYGALATVAARWDPQEPPPGALLKLISFAEGHGRHLPKGALQRAAAIPGLPDLLVACMAHCSSTSATGLRAVAADDGREAVSCCSTSCSRAQAHLRC